MSTTIESLELQIQSNSMSATNGIEALSSSLTKLKNAVKGGAGLDYVAGQTQNLNSSLKNLEDSSISKIDRLTRSLSKLSALGKFKISSSVANQIGKIGGATNSLNVEGISNIGKLTSVLLPLSRIEKAPGLKSVITQLKKLPELATTLNTIDWNQFINQIKKLSTTLTPLVNQLNTVSNAFGRLPANLNKTVSATNAVSKANKKASFSYINFWAKSRMAMNLVQNATRTIAGWITESNKYVEDLNLFTASMGDYASEAKRYAEQVSEVMGIDPGEWMRNQGVFMTITEGFGVASDRAYTMSKNLTQLGYDLSSFFNISYADSMQKLTSGISGELEPLRRLGYDLSQARLKAIALSLGIDKSFNSMTQAEKAQLRYYAIMKQVTVAQGDMARTLNAPANQLRIFQAQVTQASRALGNIFIPILNAVLPYAIAFVKVIRMIADAIAKFVGFKLPEIDYSGIKAGGNVIKDLTTNAEDASAGLGSAGKKAKELKDALLGIDELNIIAEPEKDASGALGNIGEAFGGGNFDFELPQYDFLSNAIDNKVQEITSMIESSMNEIMATISFFELAIGTILVASGVNIPLGIGLMALGALKIYDIITQNWGAMNDSLARTLVIIESTLGGFLLGIGGILTLSGVNVPLGITLMGLGAIKLTTALAINWNSLDGDLKVALSAIETAIGGATLAIGAMLALTGVNVPLGLAFILAGASKILTAIAMNWEGLSEPIERLIKGLNTTISFASLALGAILAFTGTNIPLGIALMASGATGIISEVVLSWDELTGGIDGAIKAIVRIVSDGLLGVGAVLAFTGVDLPLGIAMISTGAVGLVTSAEINWGSLLTSIGDVIVGIGDILGSALLALGAILAFSGVALPLGMGLMAAGAGLIATKGVLNWGKTKSKVSKTLDGIFDVVAGASLVIGALLCLSGVNIPLGLAFIATGAAKLMTSANIDWGAITKEISKLLGAIAKGIGDFLFGWAEGGKDLGNSLNMGDWVKNNVTGPIKKEIETTPPPEFQVKLKDTSDKWWGDTKNWWKEKTTEGLNVTSSVELEQKDWTTVSDWIGEVPTLSQTINLSKNDWTTVENWVGDIPTLQQPIDLSKPNWTTVANWVGEIPMLLQNISLEKQNWTTVSDWVGEIPILPQGINLSKHDWTTVMNWIGSLPIISQGISLMKHNWTTIANFIGNHIIPTGISLYKSGWTDLGSFIGNTVSVGVSLVKQGWNSLKDLAELSSGGYSTGHGFKMFARGGFIDSNGQSGFWQSVPMYANGTANAGLHGSLFVAGEAGAEVVGHINGQTEVLNQSQIKLAMRSAVVSGMAQFTGYWGAIHSQIAASANAIIRSVLMNTDILNTAITSNAYYDPSNLLDQSVYDDSRQAFNTTQSDEPVARLMREFYHEYVEPTLKEIASDTKRQADKEEQTIVQIGNRTITDAVVTQKRANGFAFAE